MSKVITRRVLPLKVATRKAMHSVRQVYVSDSIRCLMFIDARCYRQRLDKAVALEAFHRLAIAAAAPGLNRGEVSTALYEFLTFTEARGWQPLCFEIPATLIPLWRTQAFQAIQVDSQQRAYCYRI